MKHPGKTIFHTQEHDYRNTSITFIRKWGVPMYPKEQTL